MENVRTTPIRRATYKRNRKIRPYIVNRCIFAAFVISALALIVWIISVAVSSAAITTPAQASSQITTVPKLVANHETATPTDPIPFFSLTPEQRTLIEQVVSAECRGEPYDGQVAVAQCILNACIMDDITPEQAVVKYKYTTNRAKPTASVKEAVAAVFDRGESITEEPILYFYNPVLVDSEFHESQDFVTEISNHRFFKEGAAE